MVSHRLSGGCAMCGRHSLTWAVCVCITNSLATNTHTHTLCPQKLTTFDTRYLHHNPSCACPPLEQDMCALLLLLCHLPPTPFLVQVPPAEPHADEVFRRQHSQLVDAHHWRCQRARPQRPAGPSQHQPRGTHPAGCGHTRGPQGHGEPASQPVKQSSSQAVKQPATTASSRIHSTSLHT